MVEWRELSRPTTTMLATVMVNDIGVEMDHTQRFSTRAGASSDRTELPKMTATRGGSAGVRILYTYVTSSSDVCYDNRSYAVVQ